MAAPAPNDIRLRRLIGASIEPPSLPTGFAVRCFGDGDERALHALLTNVFEDGQDGPFETWWPRLKGDAEFDPGLCFLVHDQDGRLVAAALAWTSAFLKDLAVAGTVRRRGLGEALVLIVMHALRARGATRLDLKTNTVDNTAAVRLYQRMGFVSVDWDG